MTQLWETFTSRAKTTSSVSLTCICLVLALGQAAVAEAAVRTRSDLEELVQDLGDRGLDPSAVMIPFELSAEMQQWVHELVPPRLPRKQKLERLLEGLLESESLDLEYAWGYTGTAVEVFEKRQANCLAFTNLFVGLARELGVPVRFLAVENVASYRKADNLVVISDHIAVGYGHHRELRVFDFSATGSELQPDRLRPISDVTAVAMFYSNRGAETLQSGLAEDSIHWLETAVRLDKTLANAWVNLGVARRRVGDEAGAEKAYMRALEADPRTYSAYQNLTSLLASRGRHQEAGEYERALLRSAAKNPYSFLSLGDISLRRGRLTEARRFYRRAVHLGRDDAESYAALGEVAIEIGDLRLARKMLRKALKRDEENSRVARLAERVGAEHG